MKSTSVSDLCQKDIKPRNINTQTYADAHTLDPPLIVIKLLLDQEEVCFQLIPLKEDVTHLLLGEAGLVGILLVSSRHFGFLLPCYTWTRLMEKNTVALTKGAAYTLKNI